MQLFTTGDILRYGARREGKKRKVEILVRKRGIGMSGMGPDKEQREQDKRIPSWRKTNGSSSHTK